MDDQEFVVNLDCVLFMFSFVTQSKLVVFVLFCFIAHLIVSFLHIRSFLVPYAYVSIESIDYILLSSLALNSILLTSSVNIL